MNIGIIGAGAIGKCLASKFVKLGHVVSIANSRGPASLKQLAEEIGAMAVTVEEAVLDKDVIVVAIPQKSILNLPRNLFNGISKGAVVIDTGNYYPRLRDGVIPSLEESGIDSLWTQEQLEYPVVKVFNSIFATSLSDLGRPKGAKDRIALAVSGDRLEAKQIVFQLVDALGFEPFDLGTIAQSWRQQPGSSIYCRDINFDELEKRVTAMGTDWTEMREIIIDKHRLDEIAIEVDFSAWQKKLA